MGELLHKRVHCLGAAGAGMLPLAVFLSESGYSVSAEDDGMSDTAKTLLEGAGVKIDSESWTQADGGVMVRSSAISEKLPEIREAQSRGWSLMRRGECLAELARDRKVIAVVGSHGKTTTTGMVIELLQQSGQAFSYLLGGLFREEGRSPGKAVESEWIVAEVDESDGTIEGFSPEITLILNVDYDHHAQYPEEKDYEAAFRRIAGRTKSAVIVAADVSARLNLGSAVDGAELIEVGSADGCLVRSNKSGQGVTRIELTRPNFSHTLDVNRSSAFNVENASFAALAVAEVVGVDRVPESIFFSQLARRQSSDYISPSVVVLNDYAHHPEEIEAYLSSVKAARKGALHVVFQPHRFSRTRHLLKELSESLRASDQLYLVDVYAASETELAGGRTEDLLSACKAEEINCRYTSDAESIDSLLLEELGEEEATVVFLGAGQTDVLSARFADKLSSLDSKWGGLYRELGRVAEPGSALKANEPLAKKTTMRVGGVAECYIEPASAAELAAVLKAARESGIEVSILGRGSNLIIPDEGVAGLVIRLNHPYWKQVSQVGDDQIWVGAGIRIKELCGVACKLGLAGFEFLEGIPGNLGGALRMNAGAMGGWTFDVVERVRFMAMDGTIYEKGIDELHYGYRHCKELVGTIAIGALLKSNASGLPAKEIRATIDTYQEKRHESQPREPSAGCIFKNPEGDSAGRIVDELGLKGTAIGGAKISEIHGNFIVNTGGASSEDVIELVKLVRRVAWEKKHVELEPEAILYGSQWKAVLQ